MIYKILRIHSLSFDLSKVWFVRWLIKRVSALMMPVKLVFYLLECLFIQPVPDPRRRLIDQDRASFHGRWPILELGDLALDHRSQSDDLLGILHASLCWLFLLKRRNSGRSAHSKRPSRYMTRWRGFAIWQLSRGREVHRLNLKLNWHITLQLTELCCVDMRRLDGLSATLGYFHIILLR